MGRMWWVWPMVGVFGSVLVHRMMAHQSVVLPVLMLCLLAWFVVRDKRRNKVPR